MDSLWASMLWGTIGSGFVLYGKKQSRMVPLTGGFLMLGSSYVCETALVMSAVSVVILIGIWWASQRGVGDP
mgnify:CR=1 FL=1